MEYVEYTDRREFESASGAQRSVSYRVAKRAIDIALALVGLAIALPVVLITVGAIYATGPGPVLYSQRRCGLNGRSFRCWKLRTMVQNADALLSTDASLRAMFEKNSKLVVDPRVTTVGRFLRKSSIDELPQLWNVLAGDMSVVGPRPVPEPELREKYGPAASVVLSVKPGLTGLWQVSGRSDVTYDVRVKLDLEYVARQSLALDLKILLGTPRALLTGRGAV